MDNPNPYEKPEPNPDLALFTSDELLDELVSRFDDLVFAARVAQDQDGQRTMRQYRIGGDTMACSGLAQWVALVALESADEGSEDYDE